MHLPNNHRALHWCQDLSFLSPRFTGLTSVGRLCTSTFFPPGSYHMSFIPVDLLFVSNPSNKTRHRCWKSQVSRFDGTSHKHWLLLARASYLSTASTFHTGWIPFSPPSKSLHCPYNHLFSPPWPFEPPLQKQHVKNNQGGGCFGSS